MFKGNVSVGSRTPVKVSVRYCVLIKRAIVRTVVYIPEMSLASSYPHKRSYRLANLCTQTRIGTSFVWDVTMWLDAVLRYSENITIISRQGLFILRSVRKSLLLLVRNSFLSNVIPILKLNLFFWTTFLQVGTLSQSWHLVGENICTKVATLGLAIGSKTIKS